MASPLIEGRFGVGPSKESASKSNEPVPCVPCSLHAVGGVPSFSLSVQHGCPFPLRMDIVLTCRVFLAANVVAIASVKRCHLAKKPTWRNTLRCSATSAYSSTGSPARPGCPLFSHPTMSFEAKNLFWLGGQAHCIPRHNENKGPARELPPQGRWPSGIALGQSKDLAATRLSSTRRLGSPRLAAVPWHPSQFGSPPGERK
jgi:hypothetical protein